ncbi:MAG: transport system ATP-binding/permease protein [Clostridiales bacterium]|jgi:ATP-binding cassette subfamily F protein uup|nr:transport system ATP-binding/permease protein [Clostridiales bacterium]
MNLLTVTKLRKAYGERPLLQDISFGISDSDKIGIIGVNGSGKSTLLKIIAGSEMPDEGQVTRLGGLRIEYLPQNIEIDPERNVMEQVFRGESANLKLIGQYERAASSESTTPEVLMDLIQKMDEMDAWSLEQEAKVILTKLGIFDFDAKMGMLSGGQRKRVALAAALINKADLLILDEPTNHLDHLTIEWLETYLKSQKSALMMITHDRYFLDRVVNEIMELDNGSVYMYTGNYAQYLSQKSERETEAEAREARKMNLYRRELAWIRRGAQARSTKQKARIQRFESLKESMSSETKDRFEMDIAGTRLGKKVIEIESMRFSYGDRLMIDHFSYTVQRYDRIGIVGENGAGKSTLMRLMAGELHPDDGEISWGETVKIGYFAQEMAEMPGDMRAVEWIKEGGEYVETASGERITASQMMERFLFSSDLQWSYIGKLSGGEKRRLQLLRVLMEAPNVLMLDEPTNDLDTQTLTVLEAYLEYFRGTVILVSHDRYMLDKIADKLLILRGDGSVIERSGNYAFLVEDVLKELSETTATPLKSEVLKNKGERDGQKSESNVQGETKKNKPIRFSFKEQKEWEKIEDDMAALEQRVGDLEEQIKAAGSDYMALEALLPEKEKAESDLSEKMERWVYLSAIAEEMEGQ